MMLRVQAERMNAAFFPTAREYSPPLRPRRRPARPAAAARIVMHPGPMNRGLEISADAADSPRSTVLEQVANGVSVRMAVLYLLLSGGGGRRGARAIAEPTCKEPHDPSCCCAASARSAGAPTDVLLRRRA